MCNLRTRCLHIQLSRSCCCKQKHISTKDQDHQQNRSCHGSPPSPSSSQLAAVYVCHWLIYYACDHCHQMRTFLQTLQNFATFYNFEGELTTAQGAILFLANNQSRNSSARHTFTLKEGSISLLSFDKVLNILHNI